MDTTPANVWPLDTVNVYGETRAAAIARTEAAVNEATGTVARDCDPDTCEAAEDLAQARHDLDTLKAGGRDEFSLDGINAWSWTILADSAVDAAGRASWADCHTD